jgi:hypothetical protein
MKLTLALTGITLAVCSLAVAQDISGDRIVVPARNSTRPRKLDVSLTQGSVTVKTHAGKEVIVETAASRRSEPSRTVNGMHRIDLPPRGLTVEEEDNVVTVRMSHSAAGGVTITVPADTSLMLRTSGGNIDVDGVNGELDIQTHNGHINLTNVSGSVVAHSMNGPLRVSMNKVDPTKPLSFSTFNGPIEVTMPGDWKANLKLNTNHGDIWTDFDFKLGSGSATQPNNTADGKFLVKIDRVLTGTVNGGGPEASFHTFNGRISIKKK